MKNYLKHPVSGAMTVAGGLIGLFNLDAVVVLAGWGWANLGQVFYMVTLLVSSSSIIPLSQATLSKIVGAVALALFLKLAWNARKKIAAQTD